MSSTTTIVAALLAGLSPVAIPLAGAFYRFLLSRFPASRRKEIAGVVGRAVVAAEQVYRDIPGSSQAKKEFVVSRIRGIFGKHVSAALVEILLEEAVAALPHTTQPSHTAI